jgi:hypothetical protein
VTGKWEDDKDAAKILAEEGKDVRAAYFLVCLRCTCLWRQGTEFIVISQAVLRHCLPICFGFYLFLDLISLFP